MIRRILMLILCLTGQLFPRAQSLDEGDYTHYTTRDGLSNNYISGLEQDSAGFIWIGTYHGLNRFDGKFFKQILHGNEDPSLPDNSIFSIKMLRGGQLAIATDDGAQVLDTRSLRQRKLEVPTPDALRYWSNACRYVATDKQGNYGVSTKTGFYIFSPEGELVKRWDRYTEKDIGRTWMMFGNQISQMPDGNMMQQNSSGFKVYDRHRQAFRDPVDFYPAFRELNTLFKKVRFFFVSPEEILGMNIASNNFELFHLGSGQKKSFPAPFIIQDEIGWQTQPARINDSTWIINSITKGFYLLRVNTREGRVTCSSGKYFSNHLCTSFLMDQQGRLWIGTSKGLLMEKKEPALVSMYPLPNHPGAPPYHITSLLVDQDYVFAGTEQGEILVIKKHTREVLHRISLRKWVGHPSYAQAFLKVGPDTIWVSTHSGILWLHSSRFTAGKLFQSGNRGNLTVNHALFRDSRHTIWMGANKVNKVYRYHTREKNLDSLGSETDPLLNINVVNSITEDNAGNIWLGGDAIARWNPRKGKVDTLIELLPSQRNRKKGYTVMRDLEGDIWTSVNDDGIARLTGGFLHLRPGNLSPDNSAATYPTLIGSNILACTGNGIGILNTAYQKAVIVHFSDGLPVSDITSFHFVTDDERSTAWFASYDQLGEILLPSRENYLAAPALLISELAVINHKLVHYPGGKVTLKHFQNDINLSLTAINFTDPMNMRFAYRFKNNRDTSWLDIGSQQNILLTNISPGNYRLEVKTYAYDNKWAEQKTELLIVIRPPFHKTGWFYAGLALALTGLIFFFYKYRVKQIHQKANLDKLLAQTEMKALHAQMNPHFIFNCLNSIKEMILNNQNQAASRYLSKFAQLIRMTLDQSARSFISLHQAIDYLHRYLEMEQIRTDHFTYSIEADGNLPQDEIFIPPLLIQPFLENAIWHGALPGRQTMHIAIRFLQKGDNLVCIIDDNGIGIEASLKQKENRATHHSLGIANIRQRIQVLNEKYNLSSTLSIEDKSASRASGETGTIVTLEMPLKNTES